ncbi:hypothetical protein CsSME_00004412 [Camellia sinensis var. sinensis]
MAKQPSHLLFLLLLSLCFTIFFTSSIHARPIDVPKHPCHVKNDHHHRHRNHDQYDQVLALRGIKNSGPSPGEGHSFVNDLHN